MFTSLLIRLLMSFDYPGKYRVFAVLRKRGILDRSIRFSYGNPTYILPADKWAWWCSCNLSSMPTRQIQFVSGILGRFQKSFLFVDIGVDVGTYSLCLYRHIGKRLERVVAFEPNPRSFGYLRFNLSNLPIPTNFFNNAVTEKAGSYHFHFDKQRQSDHSGYLAAKSGNTVGVALDDMQFDVFFNQKYHVVIKIDAEGEEEEVIRGAVKRIQSGEVVILVVEILKNCLERKGRQPEDIFAAAEQIRKFD